MLQAGLKDLITAINRAQTDSVIEQYVIGGEAGAAFYIESAGVCDAEVFVKLPTQAASPNATLAPIYQYFAAKGNAVEGGLVTIGSWPTKFVTLANDLEHEGFNESISKEVDGVQTWVLTPEHLVGIALQMGGPENLALALRLLNSEAVDRNKLHLMLHRFGLGPEWHRFSSQYLETKG